MVHHKPRVLIIDDEQVVCDVLYDELSERGYQCAMALNGNDALTKLAREDFDVALVDVRLPGMSGIEVLRKIQSNHHNTVPIMITGVNDARTAVETLKLGAVDYIVKPFDLDTVNTSIRTVLETNKRLPEQRKRKTPLFVAGEEEHKRTADVSFNQMNAIARGVEAKLELVIGHSKIVTQGTIDIARQLRIPKRIIQRWAAARSMLDSERNRAIESSLNKLEQNPLAQTILGMTELHVHRRNSSESQN